MVRSQYRPPVRFWPCGRVVIQRSAKPRTPVQIRSRPHIHTSDVILLVIKAESQYNKNMDSSTFLDIIITNPDTTLYAGKASSISAINPDGPFDILPDHTNFITTVQEKIIVYTQDDTNNQEFEIKSGLLRAINNRIEIYLGITIKNS